MVPKYAVGILPTIRMDQGHEVRTVRNLNSSTQMWTGIVKQHARAHAKLGTRRRPTESTVTLNMMPRHLKSACLFNILDPTINEHSDTGILVS